MNLSTFLIEQREATQRVVDAGRDERTGIANPAEVAAAEFYNKVLDLIAEYVPERNVCAVMQAELDAGLAMLTSFVDISHPSRRDV